MVALSRALLKIIVAIMALSVLFQVWQVFSFINAGPRFTADDGKALCERVRSLEVRSYGFRDSWQPSKECRYEER